ncbi:MAG: signal peptidase II [Thermodesulfovibrionales bacterium]|jgi:signal peptidase II
MKRIIYVLLIVATVIALDQITKYMIVTSFNTHDSIEIFPFLNIVNVRNTGAAFGMFRSLGSGFFIIISLAAIIFVVNLIMRNAYNFIGLSLILGGAVGNLIDRLFYGKVVDFIDFSIGNFHWPAFNVADSSLTIGIGIILITSLLKK